MQNFSKDRDKRVKKVAQLLKECNFQVRKKQFLNTELRKIERASTKEERSEQRKEWKESAYYAKLFNEHDYFS